MSWNREQAMAALERGNEVRLRRANLRKEVAAMHWRDAQAWVAQALRHTADGSHWQHARTLDGAYVFDVLMWPRWSADRAATQLALRAGCPRVNRTARLRFRDLTKREALSLADEIDRRLAAGEGGRDA